MRPSPSSRSSEKKSSCSQAETAFEILRKTGGRITPVVSHLIHLMHDTGKVYTPKEMREELSHLLGYDITFATIYRVIDRLLASRLLYPMHRNDNQTSYFMCQNPTQPHHHHFICTSCHQVQEVALCVSQTFETFVREQLHAQITHHILQFEGICADCQS